MGDARNRKVIFPADGSMHEFKPNENIIQMVEMENSSFPVQMEFLHFDKLTEDTSKLTMYMVFKSFPLWNPLMQMSFAKGINWTHHRLQQIIRGFKS